MNASGRALRVAAAGLALCATLTGCDVVEYVWDANQPPTAEECLPFWTRTNELEPLVDAAPTLEEFHAARIAYLRSILRAPEGCWDPLVTEQALETLNRALAEQGGLGT